MQAVENRVYLSAPVMLDSDQVLAQNAVVEELADAAVAAHRGIASTALVTPPDRW